MASKKNNPEATESGVTNIRGRRRFRCAEEMEFHLCFTQRRSRWPASKRFRPLQEATVVEYLMLKGGLFFRSQILTRNKGEHRFSFQKGF